LIEELGENTVELMRTVKKAIDPLDIMNPSKVSIRCICLKAWLIIPIKLYPDPDSQSKEKSH
jgi:hypothetical protein